MPKRKRGLPDIASRHNPKTLHRRYTERDQVRGHRAYDSKGLLPEVSQSCRADRARCDAKCGHRAVVLRLPSESFQQDYQPEWSAAQWRDVLIDHLPDHPVIALTLHSGFYFVIRVYYKSLLDIFRRKPECVVLAFGIVDLATNILEIGFRTGGIGHEESFRGWKDSTLWHISAFHAMSISPPFGKRSPSPPPSSKHSERSSQRKNCRS